MALQNSKWQPLQAYLRPDTESEASLVMVEPYERGKIPVVFVHGLLSDPRTYLDIANEIRADPSLNAHYQIWGFGYPTGGPFLHSAARMRALLKTAIARCAAACGGDPALQHTVIVGHSMGGLITKLQVAPSGQTMWNSIANRPLDQLVMSEEHRAELAELVYFEPLPFVDRIVMIATPHGGSPWAGRLIGRAAGKLVEFSEEEDKEYEQLLRNNPGAFKPQMSEGFPTSIDMLEPDSPILNGERRLRIDPRVTAHSIIGTGHRLICDGPADGVVTVASARHPAVASEAYIAATHTTILRNRLTVREIKRILQTHLVESGLDLAPGRTVQPFVPPDALSTGRGGGDGGPPDIAAVGQLWYP
jgi:hypothetical protein